MNSTLLPARIIQAVGILLLIASFVFWGITGRESVLLVTSAMSLIFVGSYKNAVDSLTKKHIPPPASAKSKK